MVAVDLDIPVTLAYGAVCLFVVIALLILYLLLYLMISCENAALDIEECYVPVSDFMQPIQPVTWYCVQVAVVAAFFKIRPEEVLTEYQRDAAARNWIVRHSFPRNDLTNKFLNRDTDFEELNVPQKYILSIEVVSSHKLMNKAQTFSYHSRFLRRGYDMNAVVSKTVVALSREDKRKKKKT